MITVFLITILFISIYLAYPLWLIVITSGRTVQEDEPENINGVSLILLSFNGKEFLKDKIDFLLKELESFQDYELIIVDDNSTDGSKDILLQCGGLDRVKIINKERQRGIPHSMNIAVENAKYDYLIFCDQRQKLSANILQNIVEPLKYKRVGAVSGCICHMDKGNRCSLIRKHENFIKSKESKAGSLIGVYGPFYAIKKHCYAVIPEDIILDDLYLSLRIMKTKQIELREDCRIIDENFSLLNDYRRTRRYVSGFRQLLRDRTIIGDLNNRQKVMLLWHKYLRLTIPLFLFLCYFSSAMVMMQGPVYMLLFIGFTVLGLISVLPQRYKIQFRLQSLIRLNILYFIAIFDIFFYDILMRRSVKN